MTETNQLTHIDPIYLNTLSIWQIIEKENKNGDMVQTTKLVPDKNKVVEYMNKYLTYVHVGKPFIIEYNNKVDKNYIFHNKTEGLKKDAFRSFGPKFDLWLSSPYRKTITEITYVPYLKTPAVLNPNHFNLFIGFKHTKEQVYDEHFKVDMDQVNPWLDLIRHNWCNDDDKVYNYVIKWFGSKVQYPNKKLSSTIVITSVLEGIGKNTFFDFFNTHVIGNEFGVTVGSVEELLDKFNDHLEKALVICCDELKNNKGNKFNYVDELKKITTQTTRNIDTKFMAKRINCPDYADYVFFTNNYGPIKPSQSDRRYCCIEANCDRANDHEYWGQIYQLKNDKSGQHMFYYLAQLDLSEYNPRDIPLTQWKRELKEISIDPVIKACINYIKNSTDENINFIPIRDLYTEYSSIYKGHPTTNNRGFSVKIHKLFSLERISKTINGKHIRGILTSIPFLKEKIKQILKDPEYSFDKDEDEDEDEDQEFEGCIL